MSLTKIIDITPIFTGYEVYPTDEHGKTILPCIDYAINGSTRSVILIHRKNTVDYGNGLIGLCDGSKISTESWEKLRQCFVLQEDDGTQNFHWCIGGSDSGAVCGISPYANTRMLYDQRISGNKVSIDDSKEYIFEYGHRVEELIAKGFSSIYAKKVVKNNTVFWREDIGFMQANVDYLVDGFDENGEPGWYILEIKSTNPASAALRDYFKANPPTVPPYYYSQALHYCVALSAAFDIKGFYFAIGSDNVLSNIIGIDFKHRDIEGEKNLLQMEEEFESYLRFQTPPPLTEGVVKGDDLKHHLQETASKAEGKTATLSKEATAAAAEILKLQEEKKALKNQADELEERIKLLQCVCIDSLGECDASEPFDIDGKEFIVSNAGYVRKSVNTKVLEDKYPAIYQEVVQSSTSYRFAVKPVKRKASTSSSKNKRKELSK